MNVYDWPRLLPAEALPYLIGGGCVAAVTVAWAAWRVLRVLIGAGYDWMYAVAIEAIGVIGVIGWAQSYWALRAFARQGQEPELAADTWPALLDLFALAMGLAAVRKAWDGEHDRFAETMTVGFAAAAVACNVWAVWPDAYAVVAHGFPPLTMYFGWHWLMRQAALHGAASDVARKPGRSERFIAWVGALSQAIRKRPAPTTADATEESLAPTARRSSRAIARQSRNTSASRERAIALLRSDRSMSGAELGRRLKLSAPRGGALRRELLPLLDASDQQEGVPLTVLPNQEVSR